MIERLDGVLVTALRDQRRGARSIRRPATERRARTVINVIATEDTVSATGKCSPPASPEQDAGGTNHPSFGRS